MTLLEIIAYTLIFLGVVLSYKTYRRVIRMDKTNGRLVYGLMFALGLCIYFTLVGISLLVD